MSRFSVSFLLLLSLSLALDISVLGIPESESSLPQFYNPESLPGPVVPQLPETEREENREIPKLPNSEKSEEKPEFTETVQYIVVPVNRLHDVRNFDDIGFSLRPPMLHGHRHHHHRFGGFGNRFSRRFGNRFVRGFPGRENRMEGYRGSVNGAEGTHMETPEMTQLKEKLEMHTELMGYTQKPMNDEEKMERAKEMIKKMRKCKHHHMERGMHRHHEHHHEPREEPREQPSDKREEGGFMKQFWNLFNF